MKTFKSSTPSKNKQAGFVMTSELLLLSSVLVIGLVAGLATVRDSVNAELNDVAQAIGSMDQSYAFDGIANGADTAVASGSQFEDNIDSNAGDGTQFVFVTPAGESAAFSAGSNPDDDLDAFNATGSQ